jgi:hypothetical protein
VVDRVFERLTRFLEQRGRSGFARRKVHAGEIGGMVHALIRTMPVACLEFRPAGRIEN